jgi:hypothetical protein
VIRSYNHSDLNPSNFFDILLSITVRSSASFCARRADRSIVKAIQISFIFEKNQA